MEGIAKYSCKPCNFINNTSQLYIKHLKTDKHKKKILESRDEAKQQAQQQAEQQAKQQAQQQAQQQAEQQAQQQAQQQAKQQAEQQAQQQAEQQAQQQVKFICKKCMKQYTSNSGLWKHKKICEFEKSDVDCQLKNLIQELHNTLLDEIKDLKKLLV